MPEPAKAITTSEEAERQRALDEIGERRRRAAWARLVRSTDGLLVLHDILGHCGLFRSPMTGNAWLPYQTGKQDVARYVLAQMGINDHPDLEGLSRQGLLLEVERLRAELNMSKEDDDA